MEKGNIILSSLFPIIQKCTEVGNRFFNHRLNNKLKAEYISDLINYIAFSSYTDDPVDLINYDEIDEHALSSFITILERELRYILPPGTDMLDILPHLNAKVTHSWRYPFIVLVDLRDPEACRKFDLVM